MKKKDTFFMYREFVSFTDGRGGARLKGDKLEVYSAGIETHGLNPNAVAVIAEAVWISQGNSHSYGMSLPRYRSVGGYGVWSCA